METKVEAIEAVKRMISNDQNGMNGFNFDDLNMMKQKELLVALESLSIDILGRDFAEKMHNLQSMMMYRY